MEGLRGVTEAGMAVLREKKRASALELIEQLNNYLCDLDAKDEHKVGGIEGLQLEAVAGAGLAEQARSKQKD